MLAGHQVASQWSADGRGGEGVVETDSFAGKAIDFGRLDAKITHAGELIVCEFVRHQVNDAGLVTLAPGRGSEGSVRAISAARNPSAGTWR